MLSILNWTFDLMVLGLEDFGSSSLLFLLRVKEGIFCKAQDIEVASGLAPKSITMRGKI